MDVFTTIQMIVKYYFVAESKTIVLTLETLETKISVSILWNLLFYIHIQFRIGRFLERNFRILTFEQISGWIQTGNNAFLRCILKLNYHICIVK